MVSHQPHNSRGNYNYNMFFYETDIFEPHFHKNFELIYVLEGSISCKVDRSVFTLRKGEFGLCLPNDMHAIYPQDDSKYWVMVFSEDFVHAFAEQVKGKKAQGFPFLCNESVKAFVLHNLIYAKETSVYLLKSCLYAVCDEFKKSVPIEEMHELQVADAICLFVENNHTQNISLKDLAQHLGYDYHYVSRYFHKMFAMSFVDFLNIYRIQTALNLLEDENKKIVNVAFESGFKSVRSFNNCFKKTVGMSPSQHRKASRH